MLNTLKLWADPFTPQSTRDFTLKATGHVRFPTWGRGRTKSGQHAAEASDGAADGGARLEDLGGPCEAEATVEGTHSLA